MQTARLPPDLRSAYWDNTRFILIVLVVFGHLCAYVQHQYPWLENINTVMLVWRMPLMAFIAGTFARVDHSPGRQERLIVRLLVPYLCLQLLLGWYYTRVLENGTSFSLIRPVHTLWFLIALLWWHLWLPWVKRWPYPMVLTLAVALLAGVVDGIGEKWTLSRALVFFPYFLLGHHLAWGQRSPAVSWPRSIALCVMLICGVLLAYMNDHQLVQRLAQGSHAYSEMTDMPQGWGPGARLLIMAMSAILGAAMLALVPTARFCWTRLGKHTLYIYLLHGVTLRTLNHLGLFGDITAPWLLPVLILLPLLLAWALASGPVIQATGWLLEGRLWWSIKDRWLRPRANN